MDQYLCGPLFLIPTIGAVGMCDKDGLYQRRAVKYSVVYCSLVRRIVVCGV